MEQNINEAIVENKGGKRLKQGSGGRSFLVIIAALAGIAAAGYLGLCAYAGSLSTFYPNHQINGIDVGGLTVVEAQEKLESSLLAQPIEITNTNTGTQMTMTLKELGYTSDLLDVAQPAMDSQRSQSFPARGTAFVSALLGGREDNLWRYLDDATLLAAGERVSDALSVPVIDASYEIGENTVAVVKGRDGYRLDTENAAAVLKQIDQYSREG